MATGPIAFAELQWFRLDFQQYRTYDLRFDAKVNEYLSVLS